MLDIDNIGTLYDAPTEGLPAALPGWHVNTTRLVPAWAAQRVTPATPRRVFSGVPTFFYTFPDEAAAEAAIEAVDRTESPSVPQSVTMRQARLALLGAGKLAAVDAAINAMSEPAKSAARITWDHSQEVMRNNGLVPQLAAALGLTSAEVDGLFIAAAQL
jgi:hypothetical protein